jgi:probable F420-dependent oxidoreductase
VPIGLMIDAEAAASYASEIPILSKRAEQLGFDGFWVNETRHDPFVQLTLAASSTDQITLGTSVALAFTRSPTTVAYTAWDIQGLSKGRLILGLGSQVKGHIERRFGFKWESPARKMKEFVLALRTVWETWQTGKKLRFEGSFYKLSLMTPFFSPLPLENPIIPVFVAGVNRGMCKVAGGVGDGLHVHPLHTVKYLKEVILQGLAAGLEESGRQRRSVSVAASVFAAVGDSTAEIANIRESYRQQMAFYASTRTYRGLMEMHGWGDICDRLHDHSVKGEWDKMADEVTDDVLREFIVEGTWDEIASLLEKRYGGMVDRVRLYLPFDGDEKWARLVSGFKV